MNTTTTTEPILASTSLPETQALRRFLEAGIRAPSAENRHFLRFEPLADGMRIVSTDTPTWDAQPHRRTLALVSLGAVVENVSLASAAGGHALAVRWFPDPARIEWMAELRWSPRDGAGDPLAEAIGERHTNRRFYSRQAVDPETLKDLTRAASPVPGAALLWLDDPQRRRWALKALRLAETERFRRQALHDELFSAVRFEQGWRTSAAEGLPPGSLEVEPPMRPMFAALRRWPLMKALAHVGVHHTLGLRAADLPCRLAPHLGVIVCDSPRESMRALGAGRALQRVWLAATRHGLAFQPMAAAPVLARQRPGDGWVSAGVRDELRGLLQQVTAGRADAAYMFFRLGHAKPPSVVTDRLPLDHYLVPTPGRE
jgi:nitroreductase